MNEKKYVQHLSGQGKKWELTVGGDTKELCWVAWAGQHEWVFNLPKEDYRECAPPEEEQPFARSRCVTPAAQPDVVA